MWWAWPRTFPRRSRRACGQISQGECTEVGMYLAMAGWPIGKDIRRSACTGRRPPMKRRSMRPSLRSCWGSGHGLHQEEPADAGRGGERRHRRQRRTLPRWPRRPTWTPSTTPSMRWPGRSPSRQSLCRPAQGGTSTRNFSERSSVFLFLGPALRRLFYYALALGRGPGDAGPRTVERKKQAA